MGAGCRESQPVILIWGLELSAPPTDLPEEGREAGG